MKVILSAVILAFALAAQAGDKTSNAKEQSGCCAAKAKVACSDSKTLACAMAGKSCSANGCKETPAKQALLSPKAAASQQLVAKK